MASKSYENWKFEKVLGSGGFGQVELWKEKYSNKKIAIKKCMLPKDSITPKQITRWKQEIENMNNFKHPNIVHSEPIPSEIIVQSPVLCMEFCNKGDLRKILNKPENTCGLVHNEVLSVMKDISSALKYLHYNNITHRDLKPENVVLHETDEVIIYKLIDLGYAKELGSKTTTASLVGTFNYVAPELFWKGKYTCSVDYWSLGILFFEVLTGSKPFIPYLENLGNWMKFMKRKKYEEICAKEKLDGGIKFFEYIFYPNDFPSHILKKLTEWFRVVLQWDPRQRGKQPESNQVVVFPLLKEIFPWKTVLIFFVSSYKMEHYYINRNTTFIDLQKWIEENSSISVLEQSVADDKGNLLNKINDYERKLLKDVLNSKILYVYKNNSLEITEDSTKIPEILDLMLVEPSAIKDRSSLRQCYTALIYVMRNEIKLFKHYAFSFSTKLDIMNSQFIILKKNISESLLNTESVLNEINPLINSINSKITHKIVMDSIKNVYEKITSLHIKITQIKHEIRSTENFIKEMKLFFDSDKILKNLENFSKIYEDFLKIFLAFEAERNHNSNNLMEQINTLTAMYDQFDRQKLFQIQDPEIVGIARKSADFEKKLNSYFDIIKLAIESIPSYKNRIYDLLKKINYSQSSQNSTVNQINSDTATLDDISINTLVTEYLQGMDHNFLQMTEDFEETFNFPK